MTNTPAAMRTMITFAIIIPVAALVGYVVTNTWDYGTMGVLGIVVALMLAPVLIKWHYPIMVFGLSFPAVLFFLKGNPPFWQVAVLLCAGITIVETAMNSDRRFLKAPGMTWALLFTLLMAVITMQLTGGFRLHALNDGMGGEGGGGGRKYINLYLGIVTFFVLISRGIPPAQRKWYIGLFFLSGVFSVIGDLFPFLPSPLNYINLVFPASTGSLDPDRNMNFGSYRLGSLSAAASAIMFYLLARYGLRGMLPGTHTFRAALFVLLWMISLLGGFRSFMIGNLLILAFVFFLEGLHRTRWLAIVIILVVISGAVVVPFARQLPGSIQRSLSILPLDIDPLVKAESQHSLDWRLNIWEAMIPKIPDYLLLGKGYSLTSVDYESLGRDNPFALSARADASLESLAISNDFHSGPLSTIICFGIWGAISMLALMAAGLYIMYRNFKYGDPDLRVVNGLLLAMQLKHILYFLFIFGAYDGDVGAFARFAGFSVALNWGVCGPKAKVAVNQPIKPLPAAGMPQTA